MEQITEDADLIMDATDNFETRLLINDIAWKKNIPWMYGACVGSSGTVFPVHSRGVGLFPLLASGFAVS